MKSGDKTYIVVRSDMTPGYQAVQACHAMRQFTNDHPTIDAEWFEKSNYLALLSVSDEVELMRLVVAARDAGIPCSQFREPDVGGSITAIALGHTAKKMCEHLPLAMKGMS